MSTKLTDFVAQQLAERKLATSGLTLADAKILHIDCLPAQAVAKLHPAFKPLRALRFAYLDEHHQPLPDWSSCPPFYRLRYLEESNDFAKLTGEKPPRYVQEPNTRPVAYYPSNQDWALVQDPDEPLIITEGELKAAKACKEGFPTIGLGGVHNWRALRSGIEWLPSLNIVNWLKRHVYICFDSDYHTNEQVCIAINQLADELERRGSFVHLVSLPELANLKKTGLDDFLTFAGPSAPEQFRELLAASEPLGLASPLWAINKRYVFIQDPTMVVDQTTFAKVAVTAFKDALLASHRYQERQVRPDGTISYKPVSAANAWIKWPLRTEVAKLTYQPGRPRFIVNGEGLLNVWPGWGVEPRAGDVSPFLRLLDHLFTGAEPGALTWFLRWCAYPLQHPGVKLFTTAVFHGINHGTGKSFIGYTLGRIYGKNFAEINQMDLHNNFNEWAEAKQFIMGDDVTGSNKRADADFLKKLITQKEIRINRKYVPSYVVDDVGNYFFTANHPDTFFLDDDDRRFFIHEVQVAPLPEEFYVEYDLWLDTGGAAAVFDYLLHLDLGDFNPAAPAFKTTAKTRMIADVRSDLATWVRQLMTNPGHVLRVGEVAITRDLFSSKELLELYDPTGRTGTTAGGLGRELSRAGVRQVCRGLPLVSPSGSQARFYAVRHADHWLIASNAEVSQHLRDGAAHQAPRY